MKPLVDQAADTAARYRFFAEVETPLISPSYSKLSLGVSEDSELLALIDRLPVAKRQANLVFAAAKRLGAPRDSYQSFRSWLVENWGQVEALALSRSTQTNESARLGVIMPFIAELNKPVALLEVGSSAGLCLYPDKYSYSYDGGSRIDPIDGASEVFIEVETGGQVQNAVIPEKLPEVVWRAGIDLNPLDVTDNEDLAWLHALIWPEQTARSFRLDRAAQLVSELGYPVHRGDLNELLPTVVETVPKDAVLVVYHSAVMAYLDLDSRMKFIAQVSELAGRWISFEGQAVMPTVSVPERGQHPSDFLLSVDGQARAFAPNHGGRITWI